MRILAVSCLSLALFGCNREDPKVVRAREERRAVDAVAREVRAVPAVKSTGRWSEAELTQRLVNAGLAPHPDDSVPRHPDFGPAPIAYRLGKAHLLVWIYADSVARQRATASLDTLHAIPQGQPNAWAEPPLFVVQNNMLAVIIGGSDRARERIRLAIEAGLLPGR